VEVWAISAGGKTMRQTSAESRVWYIESIGHGERTR
jgi:hypothetical protein